MYISPDLKSKAEIKRQIAAGKRITCYQPGMGNDPPRNGKATVEGPHYPKPHTWYGEVTIVDGLVTAIK